MKQFFKTVFLLFLVHNAYAQSCWPYNQVGIDFHGDACMFSADTPNGTIIKEGVKFVFNVDYYVDNMEMSIDGQNYEQVQNFEHIVDFTETGLTTLHFRINWDNEYQIELNV